MFFVGVLTSLMRHLILSRMFITDWWVKTKVKENGHEKAYAPNGALRIKLWDGLTSKPYGCPIALSSPLSGPKPFHDKDRRRVKLRLWRIK